MKYQVFVQNQSDNHYVAAVMGIPNCVAAGRTKAEAVENARAALSEHLAQGEVVTIEADPAPQNPLLKHAGRFKDDPTYDAVLAEIEKYRRELDAEAANE